MKRYRITTPYGHTYIIQSDGTIDSYGREHQFTPSPDWKITGVAELRPFGRYRLYGLEKIAELANTNVRFNNGKPRYTLTDLNHGTRRIHGNTNSHGIERIITLDEEG